MRKHTIVLLALILPGAPAVWPADLTLATSPEFSSGKYGASEATTILSVPVSATWRDERQKFKLKLPYLVISGPQEVFPEIGPTESPRVRRATDRGLGDVVLSGSFGVLREAGSLALDIDLTAAVKFPTASSARGLGTGRPDLELQIDAAAPLGPGLTAGLSIGRRFNSDPADVDIADVNYASADASIDLAPGISMGLDIDLQEATSSDRRPIVEAGLFTDVAVDDQLTIGVRLFRGFTRDSADYGGSLTISRRFSF